MSSDRDVTVFIVEDDDAVRRAMRRMIFAAGLRARDYGSSLEFLAAFDASRRGCLLLDICMPDMSGIELQRRLRAAGSVMPIIVVTGHADVPTAVELMRDGVLDVVEKPFEPEQLLARVHEAIARDAVNRAEQARRRDIEDRIETLTPREREVMDLVVSGRTSKSIAAKYGLSPKTIHAHRAEIMTKMGAGSVAELAAMVTMVRAARPAPPVRRGRV